jgi:hypothetical protein
MALLKSFSQGAEHGDVLLLQWVGVTDDLAAEAGLELVKPSPVIVGRAGYASTSVDR